MKLKSPRSLEAWLFSIGAVLLVLMGLLWALATLLVAREHAAASVGGYPGVAATYLAFDLPISILELAGLGCVILSALVSIVKTFFSAVPK